MKLTVLGYYGGYPYQGHGTTSYLLQEAGFNLLIDCGSNAVNNLSRVLDPMDLDAVIISHYHHDHIADLGVLQYYWQLNSGQKKVPILPIYGHTQDPLNYGSLTLDNVTQGRSYSDLQPLELGPFTIEFLRTVHPVPTYAMKIKTVDKILTYTADTDYFPELVDFAKNSDVLITDSNFASDKTGTKWHMTSTESAKLAKDAQVDSLIMSHLPQEISHEQILKEAKSVKNDGQIYLAKDELQLDI